MYRLPQIIDPLSIGPYGVYQARIEPSWNISMISMPNAKMESRFQWSEIPSIRDIPGIYAWYYLPEITAFDLTNTIESVRNLISNDSRDEARVIIENFLKKFIFSYFTEEPYAAVLKGPLKPNYEGQLRHRPGLSSALIDRLVDDPERLRTVKDVLESSAPDFASPIYIGMSERLGSRLRWHRQLIEKYRDQRPTTSYSMTATPGPEQRDQSFARQIADRKINPQRLFVMIREIDAADNRYVDLENILNRIHYPLLGRN